MIAKNPLILPAGEREEQSVTFIYAQNTLFFLAKPVLQRNYCTRAESTGILLEPNQSWRRQHTTLASSSFPVPPKGEVGSGNKGTHEINSPEEKAH